eukprot:5047868-Prymnesium_polylepis.1
MSGGTRTRPVAAVRTTRASRAVGRARDGLGIVQWPGPTASAPAPLSHAAPRRGRAQTRARIACKPLCGRWVDAEPFATRRPQSWR